MSACVTSYPALGQTHVLSSDQEVIQFSVLLQLDDNVSIAPPFEVFVWHNQLGAENWSDLPLHLVDLNSDTVCNHAIS